MAFSVDRKINRFIHIWHVLLLELGVCMCYSTRINMTVWPCQQSLLAEVRGCGVGSSCDAGSCVHVYNKHGTGMACYSRYLGCGMSGS